MCYAFIFVICSSLLFLPSSTSAQNPEGFLTFRNCAFEFLYPKEWKNFISNSTDSSGNCYYGQVSMTINFPQPSLSEKYPPSILIGVDQCCEIITSRDETGFSAIFQSMSLEEYINKEVLKNLSVAPNFNLINSGPIVLAGNPAYKIVYGAYSNPSDPCCVNVYSINGTKLYSIGYTAHPSDYHTYLPGVQKIVDSFIMLVS